MGLFQEDKIRDLMKSSSPDRAHDTTIFEWMKHTEERLANLEALFAPVEPDDGAGLCFGCDACACEEKVVDEPCAGPTLSQAEAFITKYHELFDAFAEGRDSTEFFIGRVEFIDGAGGVIYDFAPFTITYGPVGAW